MNIHNYRFIAATPVWEEGTAYEMNKTVSFCANVPKQTDAPMMLALAASCTFLVTVNGNFVGHGPARTAHGYFRVDEYDLGPFLTKENNRVAIRVSGYNINTYDTLNQPSFLCAEIVCSDRVLAATGKSGFTAYSVSERVQRVQKYSFQRAFAEIYRLIPDSFSYETCTDTTVAPVKIAPAKAGIFICREVPYPNWEAVYPTAVIHRGKVDYSDKDTYYRPRWIGNISEKILGWKEDEFEYASHIEVGKCDFCQQIKVCEMPDAVEIGADTYADLSFSCNTTGLYEFTVVSEGEGALFFIFDELLKDGEVQPFRPHFCNMITVLHGAGTMHLLSAVPNTGKYVRLISKGADITVKDLHIRHMAYPMSKIKTLFVGKDASMQQIYDAAIETFRSNSVDLFSDCPSRERGGYLCDSFFTARVERILTGGSELERAFLQNFLLPDHFEYLPTGMLPMCYPADHYDGLFIPNWAMWYAVQLYEYEKRTGDRSLAEEAKAKMYALLDYFRPFENEFGLLEKLDGWVFVEWSRCNDLVQDVSFASNMLYCLMLADLGNLYNDPSLIAKSEHLKKVINQMSMTASGFFCDNAKREGENFILSGECTEACQYYAFFCEIATPETHKELWDILVKDFGYDRANTGAYPEIYPANAFIGNYLRLELLCRYGYYRELYDNIKGYFTYMAEQTGTLWEHIGSEASCNHGFASHVIYWMKQLELIK